MWYKYIEYLFLLISFIGIYKSYMNFKVFIGYFPMFV